MDEIFEFGWVPVKGKSAQDFLPGDPVQLIRNGQFKDVDIIHGWNLNEGNWFAVYLLEGYDKDHASIIGKLVSASNSCQFNTSSSGHLCS